MSWRPFLALGLLRVLRRGRRDGGGEGVVEDEDEVMDITSGGSGRLALPGG